MATGDLAAAAGLAVVSSGASLNQGYNDINTKGDELARVMTRTTSLEARTVGRQRGWRFTRPSTPAFDTFTSAAGFAGLIAGSIASAPAGDYLVSVVLSLQSPAGAVSGTMRLTIGTTNYDTRYDVDTIAQVVSVTQVVYWSGGTLALNAAMQVGGASSNLVSVFNGNSAVMSAAYLGTRV